MEDWIDVDPKEGSGDGQIKISAMPHTGRNERTGSIELVAIDYPEVVSVLNITQEAYPQFVNFLALDEIVVKKAGGSIIINGESNSAKLTFSLNDGDMPLVLPDEYKAGGETTKNGEPVKYDPGTHHAYGFRLILDFGENNTGHSLSRVLTCVDENKNEAKLIIKQKA